MRRVAALAGILVAVASALTGCGAANDASGPVSPTPTMDSIPGARVGRLAEEQLEAENLQMAVGRVTCPDLAWKVDASVRCTKISELSDGRRVTILGTVTVTSVVDGGKLHVELDDQVAEFGVDGQYVARSVAAWVARRTRATALSTSCPDLRGVRGAAARCRVEVAGKRGRVRVTVTDVDPKDFRTTYRCSWQVRPKGV